jgi:hypothetical protein
MFDFLIDILPRDEGATGMGQQQLVKKGEWRVYSFKIFY